MDKDKFPELDSLELSSLRKKLLELKSKIDKYESVLKENDLLDSVPTASDAELICVRELQRYNELSAKNIPLSMEDVKIIDLLNKNLLLCKGKVPVVVEKKTKKEEKQDVATLLKIAEKNE